MLQPDEVDGLGGDIDELFDVGLRNVFDQEQPEVRRGNRPLVLLTGDVYTSTFALWPGHFVDVDPQWGVVVSVPNRHTVMLHPLQADSGPMLYEMVRLGVPIWRSDPGPITRSLFWTDLTTTAEIRVDQTDDPGQFGVAMPPEVMTRLRPAGG